ncbi:hypothetical protein POPTR_015G043301v4 [Populus trichocarpa]|uniref:Uncharacterized protein n=1 Tax=Populus trichocarpa TaxID=3694 RepID=A0ACC0RW13_POPTR|nr:hypothetical protein BDE02_15G038500 [Populus trichocarpa]KAI9381030.1 hypothetical protein POPTR_015G043301v4 [Populus trichocarpa]
MYKDHICSLAIYNQNSQLPVIDRPYKRIPQDDFRRRRRRRIKGKDQRDHCLTLHISLCRHQQLYVSCLLVSS